MQTDTTKKIASVQVKLIEPLHWFSHAQSTNIAAHTRWQSKTYRW